MSIQLEEIDRQQRTDEQQQPADNHVFTQAVEQALDTNPHNIAAPLLAQEEIEDEEPPRINLTAVVCTAIVAVCATIILLAAHPWKNSKNGNGDLIAENFDAAATRSSVDTLTRRPAQQQSTANMDTPKKEQAQTKTEPAKQQETTTKAEPAKDVKQQNDTPKTEPSTLPVLKTTKTNTDNPYNKIRLIDASSRILTKNEVKQMSKSELALARNAIFARHGYQFKNKELGEFFAKQKWFKPTDIKMENIPYTQVELENIRLIKAQENAK